MRPGGVKVTFTADSEIRNVSLVLIYFFQPFCDVSSLYINTTFIRNLEKKKENIIFIEYWTFTAGTGHDQEDDQVFLILYYIIF